MSKIAALPASAPAVVAHGAGDLRIEDVKLKQPAADQAEAIAAVEADVVIESSGSHQGLSSAIKGAVRGGTVVMVGLLPSGPQPVAISLAITRELELVGSFRLNDEIDDVIKALEDGSLFIDPVVTHEFPLDRGLEAFEVARNSADSGKVLLKFTP